MPKLHFINGHTIPMTEDQFGGFLKRLNSSGIKYWVDRSTGDIVPFTSPSIAFLERELPVREEKVEPENSSEETETEVTETAEENEPEPESDQNKAEKALAEMKAKSVCGANKHAGQKQIIYKQAFKAARGGKVYYKYYPICEFCGEKGRFIAADKLPDDVKDAALDHVED